MFSLPGWDAYKSMTKGEVIAHIVDLCERRHEPNVGRQCAHVVVNFVEDCSIAKDRKTLDFLLSTITKSQAEPESMVSVLRCSFSIRRSLTEWYKARDKIYQLLVDKNPERGADIVMRGLMEPAPQIVEEMDGLDAWQSMLQECKKYQ